MNSISFIKNLKPLIKIVHNNIATGTLEINLTIRVPKATSHSFADTSIMHSLYVSNALVYLTKATKVESCSCSLADTCSQRARVHSRYWFLSLLI